MPRIIFISDTHSLHAQMGTLPIGDILVHCGDLTSHGTLGELQSAAEFFAAQPHIHKVIIAGNHDFCLENFPQKAEPLLKDCIYLRDTAIELCGVKFYGSPWQPRFFDWAFNLDRGPALRAVWDKIPTDTEVLITHGPPAGILDRVLRGTNVGCDDLRNAVSRIKPKIHCFGHIHESAGQETIEGTHFINASICDLQYRPVNPAVIVEI